MDTQKEPVRAIIVISGRVQGVFFRAHARDKARECGLHGWAANNSDGTLTIVAEGPRAKLRDFIQWCYTGPDLAKVSDVSVQWKDAHGDLADFNIHNS